MIRIGILLKTPVSLKNQLQSTVRRTCGFLTLRTTPMRERTCRIQIQRSSDFSWIVWRIITPPLSLSDSLTWIPMLFHPSMACGDRGWNNQRFCISPESAKLMIFTQLKLCLAIAIHNFNWVKITHICLFWHPFHS